MQTKKRLPALAAAFAAVFILSTAPVPAQAATANLSGTVCLCGSWSNYNTSRTVAETTNINMDMNNKTSFTTYMRLINDRTGNVFANGTSWVDSEAGRNKTVAREVLATTRFRVSARMDNSSLFRDDNNWGGPMTY